MRGAVTRLADLGVKRLSDGAILTSYVYTEFANTFLLVLIGLAR